MSHPSSGAPLPHVFSKFFRRSRGRIKIKPSAATTLAVLVSMFFSCILSATRRHYYGCEAFSTVWTPPPGVARGQSSRVSFHHTAEARRGGCVEMLTGVEGVDTAPGGRAMGRRAGLGIGRTRTNLRRQRGGWSTAILSSSAEAPDTTQVVDAELSDVGTSSESRRRGRDASPGNESEGANGSRRDRRGRRGSAGFDFGVGGDVGEGRDGAGVNGGTARGKLPLPFFEVKSVGLRGRWEEMGGNFLLRPPGGQAPKALLHFLGGAFVGAAPHLTYNYLLSGLAEMGFLVVATPYPLGFDYLTVCDGILDRFERAAVPLAAEYGALPVVGIGHSCGALLQLLVTCLFPDTPRAANALISFNNKPVSDAVPGFEELILPLVTQVLRDEGGQRSSVFSTLSMLRETVDNLVDGVVESPFVPALLENEVIPLVRQVVQIVDQLPGLFQQVADGTREFTPTPRETRDVVSKMYRARRTILIRFENDSIDESEEMKDIIQEGKTLLRMKRPLVDMDLRYEIIRGNHITPLTQNVFPGTPVDSIDPLLGVRQSIRKEFLRTVNDLGQILVDWLEESATAVSPPPVPTSSEGKATSSEGKATSSVV